jgi:hypothetical protein
MAPDQYFLLTYALAERTLDVRAYGADYEAAAVAYTDREMQFKDDRGIEVVLVGADSLDTIRKTHSHYFEDVGDDIFAPFLQDLPTT